MFKIAEKRQEVQDAPFTRWTKILPNFLPPIKVTEKAIVKGLVSFLFIVRDVSLIYNLFIIRIANNDIAPI